MRQLLDHHLTWMFVRIHEWTKDEKIIKKIICYTCYMLHMFFSKWSGYFAQIYGCYNLKSHYSLESMIKVCEG